jgi:hypothetical protein
VSFDDAETLKTKLDYANLRCLKGTMIWAIDLDDGTLLNALAENLTREKSEVMSLNATSEWTVTCSGQKFKYDDAGNMITWSPEQAPAA